MLNTHRGRQIFIFKGHLLYGSRILCLLIKSPRPLELKQPLIVIYPSPYLESGMVLFQLAYYPSLSKVLSSANDTQYYHRYYISTTTTNTIPLLPPTLQYNYHYPQYYIVLLLPPPPLHSTPTNTLVLHLLPPIHSTTSTTINTILFSTITTEVPFLT